MFNFERACVNSLLNDVQRQILQRKQHATFVRIICSRSTRGRNNVLQLQEKEHKLIISLCDYSFRLTSLHVKTFDSLAAVCIESMSRP
jgi:hypothetical protein